jgi:serpin B
MRLTASFRPFLSLPLLAAAGALTGCSAAPSSSGGSAPAPLSVVHSNATRDTTPTVDPADLAALASNNTRFAVDLYKSVGAAAAGQNLFFSPYSVSSTLAMAWAGARGATAGEMESALYFKLPADRLHAAFDALDLQLAARAPAVTLQVADAVWGDRGETFQPAFLDTLARDYGAGVHLDDFTRDPDGSRERINDWVSAETDQQVPTLLPSGAIAADTRLVLVDAVAFEGNWDAPFRASATKDAWFTRADGTTVTVPTMFDSNRALKYAQTSDYDVVELPYKGKQIAMDIVAPKAGTFSAFEQKLTGDALQAIVKNLTAGAARFAMPRFKVAPGSISLVPNLEALGMKRAFMAGQADFSAMTSDPPGRLYLENFVHGAYVSVDENGTVAAAATGSGIGIASAPAKEIAIDRAFFFALRDIPTGTVLFVGRVTDPSAT